MSDKHTATRGWIALAEEKPPHNQLVFVTDGRDVGIACKLNDRDDGWKQFSGHSMCYTHWQRIIMPRAALAEKPLPDKDGK